MYRFEFILPEKSKSIHNLIMKYSNGYSILECEGYWKNQEEIIKDENYLYIVDSDIKKQLESLYKDLELYSQINLSQIKFYGRIVKLNE